MTQRDPSLPPEPLPLTEASVQEIHLELMRRKRFNQFDGPRVVASLRQHRKLWRAAFMDREGLGTFDLIRLRDLPGNSWNVDTLFVLTDNLSSAHRLAEIAEEEQWLADNIHVHENLDQRIRSLGTSDPGFVVSFWWD